MKRSMVLSLVVKMRHAILCITILIGIVSLASGQMYKWVDEKGTVHFTVTSLKNPLPVPPTPLKLSQCLRLCPRLQSQKGLRQS